MPPLDDHLLLALVLTLFNTVAIGGVAGFLMFPEVVDRLCEDGAQPAAPAHSPDADTAALAPRPIAWGLAAPPPRVPPAAAQAR